MKITEVAKRLGKSPEYVRVGLREGRLPFGTAVKISDKRWNYHISEKLFKEYIGE